MRSSSGAYFIALDHVRALAVFMVIAWHFTHGTNGYPVPFAYVPAVFPFSILDEGHTGVALFMTLSGYLFAKLLDGRNIRYGAFLWNRALRLLPLLVLAILAAGVQQVLQGVPLSYFLSQILRGVVFPTLPNGGWSITVEFHFYLVLPLLLWMLRRSGFLPLMVIAAAIALRCFIYYSTGEVQSAAYWTIIGRVDQFALGMLAFRFGGSLTKRHAVAIGIMVAFMAIYWLIDSGGGFYQTRSYPSTSPLWIFLTTVEGIAYAVGIAWYDNSFTHSTSGVSRFIGRLGEYSYSIYLLHFFVVFETARFVNERVMSLSNFYLACAWAAIFCLLMMIPGWVSFRLIEGPSLKFRRRYVV